MSVVTRNVALVSIVVASGCGETKHSRGASTDTTVAAASSATDSSTKAASTSLSEGWETTTSPLGFSVDHPRTFVVEGRDTKSPIRVHDAASLASAWIWPVYSQTPLNEASAKAALKKLVPEIDRLSRIDLGAPEAVAPGIVRAHGHQALGGFYALVAVLSYVNTGSGASVYLYVARAPRETFKAHEATLARILASFRAKGPEGSGASGGSQPTVSFQTYLEPKERAFSVKVPAGASYETTGGVAYPGGQLNIQPHVTVAAKDGSLRATIGDKATEAYHGGELVIAAFGEGGTYPLAGLTFRVKRMHTGLQYAQDYVTRRVAALSGTGLTFTSRKSLEATADRITKNPAFLGSRATAGEVRYSYKKGGLALEGYYMAIVLVPPGSTGDWYVWYQAGFEATKAQAPLAQFVLENMVGSYKLDDAWLTRKSNQAAETSRILSQTQDEIAGMLKGSYENRQSTLDAIADRRSRATLEVEDVVDPTTGNAFRVEAGSNYYWIDAQHNIVGTNTDSKPAFEFKPLVQLP